MTSANYKFYNVENIIRIGSAGAYTGDIDLYDLAGNKVVANYNVSNIDKVAPTVEEVTYSPNVLTNTDVEVTIKLNEEVKAVKGWTLSEDKKSITKVFAFNKNGKVEIYDLAGNKVVAKYNVTNIDKVPAFAYVSYSTKLF